MRSCLSWDASISGSTASVRIPNETCKNRHSLSSAPYLVCLPSSWSQSVIGVKTLLIGIPLMLIASKAYSCDEVEWLKSNGEVLVLNVRQIAHNKTLAHALDKTC